MGSNIKLPLWTKRTLHAGLSSFCSWLANLEKVLEHSRVFTQQKQTTSSGVYHARLLSSDSLNSSQLLQQPQAQLSILSITRRYFWFFIYYVTVLLIIPSSSESIQFSSVSCWLFYIVYWYLSSLILRWPRQDRREGQCTQSCSCSYLNFSFHSVAQLGWPGQAELSPPQTQHCTHRYLNCVASLQLTDQQPPPPPQPQSDLNQLHPSKSRHS